jgi:hypothetical protein
MIDRVEKQRIMGVLRQTGLWAEAKGYREAARQRLRKDGQGKPEAVEAAWREMAELFEPIARKIENLTRQREQAPAFVGYAGDVDEITDPDYHQPDAGKRLRDAFVWAGNEFRRITNDSPTGTRMDFSRAKTPPPSPLAVQIAEYYAENRSKRGELFWRLAAFAEKQHDAKPEHKPQGSGSFLHEIE